jgi:sugar phosphate isomerase/epimerase
MPREISLAALTVLELAPPETVACAAQAGYSHVGLRLIPATPEEVDHRLIGDTPMVRETLARLADTGIGVLDAEIFRLRPETRVKDYCRAMETAARLAARHLLVAGNDPDEARLTDRFGAFCDLAATFGLTAVLEFMPWTDARDLTQAARIVGAAARTNGGVLIDAFHFDRSGSSLPISLRSRRRGCPTPSSATSRRSVPRTSRASLPKRVPSAVFRARATLI